MASARRELARYLGRPLRSLAVFAFSLAAIVLPAGAQAAHGSIGASIDQCANGESGIADCTGAAWINGNLNENKSLYKGGDFVPFRAQITNLTGGSTYTLRIGYDAVEGGLHAYDYLGSYDATENAAGQRVDPCDGSQQSAGDHACGHPPSRVEVPVDGDHGDSYRSQVRGDFSAWGGSLTGAAYVSPDQIGVSTTGTVERQIDVTFVAEGDTVVLAWGGHIASSLDWGAGETFVGNGSALRSTCGSIRSRRAVEAPRRPGRWISRSRRV